ncbi:hypothetical protein LTS18_007977 [Coniosporium uncinatum]|uniref:Uncharacterized protein n=1 Tax=Coniosporium uncinatum TaxID=93489 RepID=A0ACC3DAQ8_9PEZI|nr:hypothetical protein LTS18_007977 [Coniosporium uncinatum]
MEPTPTALPQHSEEQSPERPIREPYPAPAHAEPTDAAQKPEEVKPSVEDDWEICGPRGCQSLRPVIADARHGTGESMFESQHPLSEGVSGPGVEKNALWVCAGHGDASGSKAWRSRPGSLSSSLIPSHLWDHPAALTGEQRCVIISRGMAR